MKGRVIVLDRTTDGRAMAALMVDGRMEDLLIDPPGTPRPVSSGDILWGEVTRKLPKAGAFLILPEGREAYLRDAKSVRPGQRLPVQVVGLAEPGKAPSVTARLLVKGPRVILTPAAPGVNVSRRIGNAAERDRLEAAVGAALSGAEESLGAIVRTSARDAETADLARETEALLARLAHLRAGGSAADDAHDMALREWITPAPDAILCRPEICDELNRRAGRPPAPVQTAPDPFEASGAAEALAGLAAPASPLPGGASLVVEATRALIAADVNTGPDFSPAAGLKTNLAAARDLPRQLRLRGLGGQIVVDFAPMPKQHRRTLDEALKKAFRDDPVETSLVGWTAMGLYEMQRKRERHALTEIWGP